MKRNRFMQAILLILLIIGLCACQKNNQQSESLAAPFTFDAEHYVYEGGRLTAQQVENMDAGMVDMVQKIVCSVNESKTEIDLTSGDNNEQWIKMSMQVAATVDPLVEVASFEMDQETKGLYHIVYGCSEEEHRRIVAEFNQKVESIVRECASGAETDVEYAKEVFEYLVDHCQYDYGTFSASREHGITKAEGAKRYRQMSVYQVLMNGTGVCQQFSRAYSLLLRQADIPVLEIAGISNVPFASNNAIYNGKTEGELFGITHMWNEVQLSGQWYGADITFAVNAVETGERKPYDTIYRYFGMSDETMQSHFSSNISIATPGCQTMDVPICEEELTYTIEKNTEDKLSETQGEDEDGNVRGVVSAIDVNYDIISCDETGDNGSMVLYFEENDTTYQLHVSVPKDYCKDNAYGICYLLGKNVAKEMALAPEDMIYVHVTAISKEEESDQESIEKYDFCQNPGLFLNIFMGGIVQAVESAYPADIKNRILCGEGSGANMCVYALFQNDGMTKDAFTKYICVNPDMYCSVDGKGLSAYDELYFDRCKQLSTSLLIRNMNQEDEGQSARINLFADRIKKREYQNFTFQYEVGEDLGDR